MTQLPYRPASVWRVAFAIVILTLCSFELLAQQKTLSEPAQTSSSNGVADSTASPNENKAPQSTLLKPKWELGIGGGFFSGFDYPASSQTSNRGIALPFFIYRSPIFRAGDGGVRAVAIERPRLTLDLSLGGSLNANSDGNTAREGMPDLDFLFEIGPRLQVQLFDTTLPTGERARGRFKTDLRAVFATDFSGVESKGWVSDIGFGFNLSNIRGTGIDVIMGFDATFASEPLQDYFYQVDTEFVTPERPFFDAQSGYLESALFAGFAVQPFKNVRVFTGLIQGFFRGARNAQSPLFEVQEQTSFALGVVWKIATSDNMIEVVDLGSSN